MSLFIIIVMLLLLLVVFFFSAGQFFNVLIRGQAPLISTSRRVIAAILREVTLQEGEAFYELGAGKTRILRALEKRYPLAKYVGVEFAWFPYLWSRALNGLTGRAIEMRRQNLFKADISQADYIYCYLLPDMMGPLEEKLRREGKPGATLISLVFQLKANPYKTVIVSPRQTLYFYKIIR